MKKESLFIAASIALALAALALAAYSFDSHPKIAYIRSQEVIDQFEGMKAAQARVDAESQKYMAQMDTLKLEYSSILQEISAKRAQQEDVSNLVQEAQRLEFNMERFSEAIALQLEELEEKYLQGAINQMNTAIEAYGELKGYDIIYGSTLSGSIMYGGEALDITDEIVENMNTLYN